jgi:hypothetical protein
LKKSSFLLRAPIQDHALTICDPFVVEMHPHLTDIGSNSEMIAWLPAPKSQQHIVSIASEGY